MVDLCVVLCESDDLVVLFVVIDEVICCKFKGYDFIIDCDYKWLVVVCYMSVIGG